MIMTKKYINTETCSNCGGKGCVTRSNGSRIVTCSFCQGRGLRLRRDNVAFNIRSMPRDLRGDFKSLCARNGLSMERALLMLMQRAVENGDLIAGDGT